VAETDDAVEVSAELPGLDEDDVRVTLDNGILTVEGEKKTEREEKKRGVFFSERSYGRFQRSVALPAGIDESKVKASFKKGVLRVTIPKAESARATRRSIPIEAE
jgi:HSP20 family protein